MGKMPDIVPVTDLRQDAAAVLRRLRESEGPLVITQRGRAAAIMISPESYERTDRERELLLRLARGERDLAQGKGHTVDQVLRETRNLLENKL